MPKLIGRVRTGNRNNRTADNFHVLGEVDDIACPRLASFSGLHRPATPRVTICPMKIRGQQPERARGHCYHFRITGHRHVHRVLGGTRPFATRCRWCRRGLHIARVSLLFVGFRSARPMVGRVRTAHGLFVQSLECALPGGRLLAGQVLRLGGLFVAVIFVTEL